MKTKCAYEEIAKQEHKSTKMRNPCECPKCECDMLPTIKHDGVKWDCTNVLEGCYHDFWEATE